jgi:signal transduction histidine kinase
MIEADGPRLEQVFTNLLQNAIKYSPHGGAIHVELACWSGHVTVAVRDRGIGIPEEEQQQLFTRFFRATNTRDLSGMGIGLYLVHDIVTRHGGAIQLDSHEGVGTTVSVELPLQVPRAAARPAQAAETEATPSA